MQTTNISWSPYSWNPVTGCSKAGPECANCYAETFSLRQGRTDHEWTHENAAANVTMHEDRREMDHDWAVEILEQARRDDAAFYFKQSSGLRPETGTRLSVPNDERGIYEQRRIREYPDLPDVTVRARQSQGVAGA